MPLGIDTKLLDIQYKFVLKFGMILSENKGEQRTKEKVKVEHTTRIELENLKDLYAVELGVIKPEDARRLTIEDALVDTGATGLCLPKSFIEQLGLTPLRNIRVQTANGPAERTFYSEVKYTVLERSHSIQVTDFPEDAPVLVGHM